jgi:hypothetical protein
LGSRQLELATPLFPAYFLPLASLANSAKGIAGTTNGTSQSEASLYHWSHFLFFLSFALFSPGLTTGATKAAINQGFALRDNLGDITAKGTSLLSQGLYSLLLTSHVTLQRVTLPTTQQATRRAL